MLKPFTADIDRLSLVFAHCGRKAHNGNRVYAVAARTLYPDRPPTDFEALVSYPFFGLRERHYSNLNRDAVLAGEPPEQVRRRLAAFLDQPPFILVLDPYGDLAAIAAFCGGMRTVDLSFAAEFLLPQLTSFAPTALWEYLHDRRRRRKSFTAPEMVALGERLLAHIGGEVLNSRLQPRAATLRHYLRQSGTLFGQVLVHMATHHRAYYGELLGPAADAETPNWRLFLERVQPGRVPPAIAYRSNPVAERHLNALFAALTGTGQGFQPRAAQRDYAAHVAEAVNQGAILCLEAGTGTGKTLGYLLPLLSFLARNPGAQGIISTYTKNLQEQLFEREWPICRALLPHFKDIPAVLLKGKRSYLCVEKLDLLDTPHLTGHQRLAWLYLVQLIYHFHHTDVDGVGEKVRHWLDDGGRLAAMLAETTAASGCTHRHVHCPAQIVTAAARHARLVVTNHHKLALMGGDPTFAGRFRTVVIDEANHFENAVRGAFQSETASHELSRLLSLVGRPLKAALRRAAGQDRDRLDRVAVTHIGLRQEVGALHRALMALDPTAQPGAVKELVYRHAVYRQGRLNEHLNALVNLLGQLAKGLESFSDEDLCRRLRILPRTAQRVGHAAQALLDQAAALKRILLNADTHTHIAAYACYGRHWVLTLQAVDVSGLIRERIYPDRDGVVFTAATLRHQDSFRQFRRIVGLDRPLAPAAPESVSKPILEATLPSPFDPAALTVDVPAGALSGRFANKPVWLDAVVDLLPDLIHRNQGRTLVLFASYADLAAVAARIERPLAAAGYPLLVQRKGDPTVALCDDFRTIKESVLLGVESFWYGVDFKGDTLTQVIITRIPYPAPTDPLQLARRRADNKAYWERYHYDTAIKLRQGVGRLIRSESDRGRVLFLDTRIRSHTVYQQLVENRRRSGPSPAISAHPLGAARP